jgi:hypothetical protein
MGSLRPPSSGPTLSAHVEVVSNRARVETSSANFRALREGEVRRTPLLTASFSGYDPHRMVDTYGLHKGPG